MPTRGRGIVFTGPGQVALEDVELPDPGPQQVLVRHTRTLVSAGTEVSALLGREGQRWPARPGYASAGVVEALGEGVEGLRPGDRVLTRHRHASHALVDLTPGRYSETARQPALPEVQLQPLPAGVADDHAAFAVLASVALHGVRKAALQLGESAAVVGQGVVGQLVGQFARLSGALPLIAVDRVASRLERARQGGAHATVDASREDVREAVRALTGGAGVDAGFEATRTPGAFPALLGLMAVGGRVVMVGSVHERASLHLFDDLQRQEVTIIGAWHPRAPVAPHHEFPWSQARNRAVFLDLLRAGLVQVEHLITHRARPEEAPRLYAELAAAPGDWLGVLFVWD